MKTKLTILNLFLTLFIFAQKNKYDVFQAEYYKLPKVPVVGMKGGENVSINTTLEFGKTPKYQKEIDGINLGYNKKVKSSDITFNLTFKEPVADIKKEDGQDKTEYYRYNYSTKCFVEVQKGGKIVDTTTFIIPGKSIRTISAAPIAIVDKYAKSPVFKVKISAAKKNSLKEALEKVSSELTTRYAYKPSTVLLTYNEYEKGAQGRDIDVTNLNTLYNNYKVAVANYKSNPEESRAKLEEVLKEVDGLIETKTSEGKYFYNVQEIHYMEVLKLEILALQYKFDAVKKQKENLEAMYIKGSQQKRIYSFAEDLEKNYNNAKKSGLEFKY